MPTVSLLGVAHIHTPGFLKRLGTRDGFTVKRVYDHDAARAARRAGEVGADAVADPSAALDGVDAVVICSETDRHRPLVDAAAAAGLPMFVEKPLGMDGDDADAMADTIGKAGVLFQTGYFMRSDPAVRRVKQMVADGAFGTISRVRGSNCHSGSLSGWFDEEWRWMADPARAGCGAFGDLGTHSLDLLLWLFGPVTDVTAQLDPVTNRYGCDESGEALMRFEDGPVGTLAAGWVDRADPVSLLVSGTDAHAMILNGDLIVKSEAMKLNGKIEKTDLPPALPHAFDLFLDALEGKPAELVGAKEAAYRSKVMAAMYKAASGPTWERV